MRVQGFDGAPEDLGPAIFNPLKMPLTYSGVSMRMGMVGDVGERAQAGTK